MSFALDVILIIICILVLVISTKRGFFKTLMSLVSKIVALICAFTFTPALAELIKTRYLLDPVAGSIAKTIKSLAPVTNGQYDLTKLFNDMPKTLSSILTRYNVDQTAIDNVVGSAADKGEEAISSISEMISAPIVDIISKALSFLAIYLGVVLILAIVTLIINSFFKLPVLREANTVGGFVLGVIISVIIIVVYSSIASTLVPALGSISPKLFGDDVINKTILVRFVSEHDFLGMIKNYIN